MTAPSQTVVVNVGDIARIQEAEARALGSSVKTKIGADALAAPRQRVRRRIAETKATR